MAKRWEMNQRTEINRGVDELDDEGRNYVLSVVRSELERVRALSRARLRLVRPVHPIPSLPKSQVNPSALGGAG